MVKVAAGVAEEAGLVVIGSSVSASADRRRRLGGAGFFTAAMARDGTAVDWFE